MKSSSVSTVEEYLKQLPEDRRSAIDAVREVILSHLPEGYVESFGFGMIGYVIPLERYPNTYNKQPLAIASLGSQKNYMSLYLMGVYGDEGMANWFTNAFKATGKKLDMGKSCVRFKTLDDLPLDVIGEAISRVSVDTFLRKYEESRKLTKKGK